ncbi:MAG: M28 family peptidase [Candidatus Helarchaeota archaeon]
MAPFLKASGAELYDTMLKFIQIGWRRPGTPEAHKTALFILNKLKEFSLEEVRLEPFEMMRYLPKRWKLTIKSDSLPESEVVLDSLPAWHSHSLLGDEVEGELIYVGLGTTKEFQKCSIKDKIVVVESFRMMNFYPTMDFFRAYERARKKGAIGFIGIHDTPPGTIFAEYATRHQTLKDTNLTSGSIPSLYIGFETGQYLKSLLTREPAITAKILLETSIRPAPTDNLIGFLPGQTGDILLIGTHIDSWFDGAIDNAGGNAGFLAIAEYFSQLPISERGKTMVFAGFAGHEVGSIGVLEFARKHNPWFDKISTFCMIDGFGSKGFILENPSRGVIETGLDEAKGFFTTDNKVLFELMSKVIFKYHLFPVMHISAVAAPFSDLGPLVAAHVPSTMLIGKGIFYHTIEDTADKVLPDQLERTTNAYLELLQELHQVPTDILREADRKGIPLPKEVNPSKQGNVYLNFNIVPNPMIKGTTALLYLTSYLCKDRIIVDSNWIIDGKKPIRAPILPYLFNKVGIHKVKLVFTDNFGNEYSNIKYAYVLPKP